ncbi:helix-turn-helix domain-containing protein [Corynebacterium diphtheriae]|uniref:helix-turn-helix domain-containing protein n=1 Tax=Corynebacterium diphtheriae TaxID=1717 RepID=UPI00086E467F|nr:helix-turn-helix domain-containing protein [Corynebacterium diphtheriae]MBG9295042.1 helix-turn-helix domain-containing protein [Corynebacterium diphtheriae bv. mitis]MBG9316453.1 helix-turn-helix domain-containing protein [Corynebacterium diphtheriae bv. mitis]MBG9335632.1 helix-turn-helix domain-containing protein [Corynebacterium diphtheriae bv. gravis]ODS17715.1 hypothetical protein BGK43_02455 [Corynebacterium diphtheriae]OEH71589.1 hypothetical protein BHU48_03455 [Corynebacterium dip
MATLRQGPQIHDMYTMIANDLLRRPDISFNAKAIYCFMRSHREGWEVTTKRIADNFGVSVATVKRALKELEDVGYIAREQGRSKGGAFKSVDYIIMAEPTVFYDATGDHICTPVPTCEDNVNAQVTTGAQNTAGGEMSHYKKTIYSLRRTNKKEDMPAPQNGAGDNARQRFLDWYATYPRKVGREKAFQAWKKATKLVSEDELMAKTQAFATHHAKAGTDKQYIPHPTTWLNRGGWDDELTTSNTGRGEQTYLDVLAEMGQPRDFIDAEIVGELE